MTRGRSLAGTLRRGWTIALACVLALAAAAPALALGLGQIQVRSQAGQPLLAEIPIVSSDPSELDNLQARLASPETFRRIGLPPPQGIVSDLQFAVALDARGQPVIRVTSAVPVQEPLLSFLVEVDWGQGRLVREYSALLDAPRTVSAPVQPPIQAPAIPPSNTIVRPAQSPLATADPDPGPEPIPEPETPVESDAVAAAPAPALPAPVPPPAPASDYGPVQAGETLGRIAARLAPAGYTHNQTMLALLRANPQAFIGDNINLVREGAVLRMPQDEALSQYTAAEATAVVRAQISRWREMRAPAPQPEAAGEAANRAGSTAGAPRVADARLEIVPPSQGSGQRAGTRSGIETGGEGEMLRQELQQTRETLAARNAEVEELKARVADLEQLQQQQQQLISLKDSELAAVQQRLATSNQQPVPTVAQASTPDPAAPAAGDSDAAGLAWLWIGLALLAAAAVAWLFLRRKQPAAPARVFDTSALAAGMSRAPEEMQVRANRQAPDDAIDAGAEGTTRESGRQTGDDAPRATAWDPPPEDLAAAAMPTWHSGHGQAPPVDDAATVVALNPAPAGPERIELARAYLDLGDTDTARSLLQEVVDGGDPDARAEAARLLRDLA